MKTFKGCFIVGHSVTIQTFSLSASFLAIVVGSSSSSMNRSWQRDTTDWHVSPLSDIRPRNSRPTLSSNSARFSSFT